VFDSVQSVLSQTYKNFEFLIIDDGSTDRTLEIIESIKDERIRIYKRNSLSPSSHTCISADSH
ncbi:MAG: glycosyltransferase family 2 protein, partial [Nanoarchaeota archaeon]|nr:glycosyltransferase family 2 protein [Nanoarchaeota archaeon]